MIVYAKLMGYSIFKFLESVITLCEMHMRQGSCPCSWFSSNSSFSVCRAFFSFFSRFFINSTLSVQIYQVSPSFQLALSQSQILSPDLPIVAFVAWLPFSYRLLSSFCKQPNPFQIFAICHWTLKFLFKYTLPLSSDLPPICCPSKKMVRSKRKIYMVASCFSLFVVATVSKNFTWFSFSTFTSQVCGRPKKVVLVYDLIFSALMKIMVFLAEQRCLQPLILQAIIKS